MRSLPLWAFGAAAAAGLVFARVGKGAGDPGNTPATATDAAATDAAATSSGLWGQFSGDGFTYDGGSGGGVLISPDPVDTQPITPTVPTPTTPTPTPPKVPYLFASVRAGSTLGTYTRRASDGAYGRTGTFTTAAGFSAEVRDLGTVKLTTGGTTRLVQIVNGAYAGRIIGASNASITTRYR